MQSEQFQLHADIETTHWWFVGRRRILRALVEKTIGTTPGATVLDVGCGTGANLAAFAERFHCVGVDTSHEAINLAQQRYPGIDFRCGVAPDDVADVIPLAKVVLLTDVLEHVPDDFDLLSKLLAAMSPGAHLLVTVPAEPSLWSQHDRSFGHYRRYDPQRFRQVWKGLPVTPRLVSHFNSRLYPAVKLVRSWSRRQGEAAGNAGTDFYRLPEWLNGLLASVFAAERRVLIGQFEGRRTSGYSRGVSLIAVLRREAGEIKPRHKPADLFDAQASSLEPLAKHAAV